MGHRHCPLMAAIGSAVGVAREIVVILRLAVSASLVRQRKSALKINFAVLETVRNWEVFMSCYS